jgi:polyhydroxybutyrate depolymerase
MIPAFYANVSDVKLFRIGALLLFACSDDAEPTAPAPPPADAGSPAPSTPTEAATTTDPLIEARPYATTVPSSYLPSKPAPMVILLHGYLLDAETEDNYFGLSKLAKDKGFLVALPNGTKSSSGSRFWNATDACCNLEGSSVDDVAYLTAVIADMKHRYNVDPKRVFIAGHSNGGFMAHRMACERSADIAAIMSLAGEQFLDPQKCKADHPVAVLQVQGDQDEVVAYGGGAFAPGLNYPGAKRTIDTWAAKNGCNSLLAATTDTLDLDSSLSGDETTISRHFCTQGAAELWTIAGGKHIPKFQPTWAARFWDFFATHPKE